jgi:hypothetical protein
MSASSRDTSRPVPRWVRNEAGSQHAGSRRRDRLPWPLAVPLIVMMCLVCWAALWKGGAAVLTLLN